MNGIGLLCSKEAKTGTLLCNCFWHYKINTLTEFFRTILTSNGFVEVKQRAGCLSYIVDKLGYHSQLAKTLTQSETVPWNPSSASIVSFTHDQAIKYFCDHFLTTDKLSPEELKLIQVLTKVTYDAVVKDKLIIVPVISFLLKVINSNCQIMF